MLLNVVIGEIDIYQNVVFYFAPIYEVNLEKKTTTPDWPIKCNRFSFLAYPADARFFRRKTGQDIDEI